MNDSIIVDLEYNEAFSLADPVVIPIPEKGKFYKIVSKIIIGDVACVDLQKKRNVLVFVIQEEPGKVGRSLNIISEI